eukprot:TRINITY_DN776_c0_g1_i1.p1 TRINITY_DN776_c0_g1~~TRINITY_DN776_c0_g1_i1.p1  ORF type:complete len:144 (+),score=0.93 TRINITY_DN776_c0_g1_i1:392-823(+)
MKVGGIHPLHVGGLPTGRSCMCTSLLSPLSSQDPSCTELHRAECHRSFQGTSFISLLAPLPLLRLFQHGYARSPFVERMDIQSLNDGRMVHSNIFQNKNVDRLMLARATATRIVARSAHLVHSPEGCPRIRGDELQNKAGTPS